MGFLKRVYSSSYSVLNPEYSQLIKEDYESNVNSITLSDVMNAYIELINLRKFEDALIIHFIYSLRINPETISLLTFDSINDEDNMTYFDTTTLKSYERYFIYKKLYKESNRKADKGYRYYKDKVFVVGDFIISVSDTAIYNRFSRCFGGKLRWFRHTPEQIIHLSKEIKSLIQNKDKNQCLDLIQNSIQLSQEENS